MSVKKVEMEAWDEYSRLSSLVDKRIETFTRDIHFITHTYIHTYAHTKKKIL